MVNEEITLERDFNAFTPEAWRKEWQDCLVPRARTQPQVV